MNLNIEKLCNAIDASIKSTFDENADIVSSIETTYRGYYMGTDIEDISDADVVKLKGSLVKTLLDLRQDMKYNQMILSQLRDEYRAVIVKNKIPELPSSLYALTRKFKSYMKDRIRGEIRGRRTKSNSNYDFEVPYEELVPFFQREKEKILEEFECASCKSIHNTRRFNEFMQGYFDTTFSEELGGQLKVLRDKALTEAPLRDVLLVKSVHELDKKYSSHIYGLERILKSAESLLLHMQYRGILPEFHIKQPKALQIVKPSQARTI